MQNQNFHNGISTGNFKVILGGLCVKPPDTCFPSFTFVVTVGPIMFQLLVNNSRFVEN